MQWSAVMTNTSLLVPGPWLRGRPLVAFGELGHVLLNILGGLLLDRLRTLQVFYSGAVFHLLGQDVIGQLQKWKQKY